MKSEPAEILIVEDERIVALDISGSLKSLGYNVAGMVSNGSAAIEVVEKYHPDLILMDIMIQGSMDGIETAEKIHSKYDIPVIYLTAYADDNTLARAKITEPYGYIIKPFDKKILHTVIEMALYKNRIERKLKDNEKRLKVLSKRLIEIQESERRHLAGELHDEIGQVLTAIKINLLTANKLVGTQDIQKHLTEGVELVEEAIQQVRKLSLDLRPSMLDDLGLVPALRWYVDRQTQWAKIKAKVIAENLHQRFASEIEITCFRICQEALNNIIKHSKADHVEFNLKMENKELHLHIHDNGNGFVLYDAIQKGLRGESMGILGMQERVELAGGLLTIDSKPGKGTTLHAVFENPEPREIR